jgi:HEPN domain-containing protein
MATCEELKTISKARLKSASVLMKAGDWDGAAYMLGYALECALKAATCKSLRLNEYPSDRKKASHFMTHNFDELLIFSGLSDLFNLTAPVEIFQNWSDFTKEFPGKDWPAMRYDLNHLSTFTESKVKGLYDNLTEVSNGILSVIKIRKRW